MNLASFVLFAAIGAAPATNLTPPASPHPIVPAFERFHAAQAANLEAGGRLLLGELNCTSCHAADATVHDWISPKKAPNLRAVGDRVRPEHFRKLLNAPHDVKPGTTMPDVLGHLSATEKSQAVEALTHFLVSTATEPQSDAFIDRGAVQRGEKLFHEVGCAACHNSQKTGAKPIAFAMPLPKLAEKYTLDSLAGFLRDPSAVRSAGRMPSLNLSEQDAHDIASYFLQSVGGDPNFRYAYYEGSWERLPNFAALKPIFSGESVGLDLQTAKRKDNYGLRFEGFLHLEKDGSYPVRLYSDDGAKLFIDDAVIIDHDGIHAAGHKESKAALKAGTHRVVVEFFQGGGGAELAAEIRFPGKPAWQNLASFVTLTSDARQAAADEFKVNVKLADEGKRLFASVGCANCHELKVDDKAIASTFKAPALSDLATAKGCTPANGSSTAGKRVPNYSLSAAEIKALTAALNWARDASRTKPMPSANDRLAHTLASLNCYACHQRDGRGGVDQNKTVDLDDDGVPDRDPTSELLSPLFVGTTPEMGDEGRLPPRLDGVGSKLTDGYLKQVLERGAKDRPYMTTIMPRFGGDVAKLAALFREIDAPHSEQLAELADPAYRIKADGRLLVGTKGFGCVKCHQFNKQKAEGIQGIDMTVITRRVRPEWFMKYVFDPQSLRQGTRMPSVYPNGQSPLKEILAGDPAKQIAAMWMFLADGDKAAVPFGVGGQPIELVAAKEPVIYRNFIQGAGSRAIGVGYPEKVNLAFDADNLRPALLWHGAFIDAAMHWSGRGNGFQTPLGDDVLQFAPEVEFARLKSTNDPWPTKSARELGYRFRGYELDDKRRPVFHYDLGEHPDPAFHILRKSPLTDVVDRFTPVAGTRPGMLRVINISIQPPDGFWFRAAAAKRIKPLEKGWYEIDGMYRVRIAGGNAKPTLRESNGKQELLFPLVFASGRCQVFQEFQW